MPVPIADTVVAGAQMFADQIAEGACAEQWAELAPQAQAMWPGEAARTAMLTSKFAGAPISAVTVGPPTVDTTWYDPENPDVSVDYTWQFPVSVYFADADSLSPPGVAPLFDMTTISLTHDETTGTALVVGEGPASIDAPVIVPSQIPARQVHVPIFMYHEIRPVPPESEAAQLTMYGWQVEVALTTLPSP